MGKYEACSMGLANLYEILGFIEKNEDDGKKLCDYLAEVIRLGKEQPQDSKAEQYVTLFCIAWLNRSFSKTRRLWTLRPDGKIATEYFTNEDVIKTISALFE